MTTSTQAVTITQALQQALGAIVEAMGLPGTGALPSAIEAALAPPSPAGTPTDIAGLYPGDGGIAQVYSNIGNTFTDASLNLTTVAKSSLPTAWRGHAAENASQATQALAAQAGAAGTAFDRAHVALTTWASTLVTAKRTDARGLGLLEQAKKSKLLGGIAGISSDYAKAWELAYEGCNDRLTAAKLVESAASFAADTLNQLAATARARDIHSPGIDPLTSVVLSYSTDSGWLGNPLDTILTPNGLALASQSLNSMSAADQAAFEKMLAAANSPQEAAYLWKALGAGYSLSNVQQFDQVIHPHGHDLNWLSQHLDPQVNDTNLTPDQRGQYILSYEGQKHYDGYDFYSQLTNGDVNSGDCVAASTVIARAANDPVYMLGLTTGEGPIKIGGATVGDSTPAAFRKRLEEANTFNYAVGNTDDHSTTNANTLLKGVAGSSYQDVSMDTTEQRQEALPKIEAAVDSGKPVPLGVHRNDSVLGLLTVPADGHQMMILAAKGNELEIYNPWGYTQWVTTQQFVDGQLGDLTSNSTTGGSSIPDDVELPQ